MLCLGVFLRHRPCLLSALKSNRPLLDRTGLNTLHVHHVTGSHNFHTIHGMCYELVHFYIFHWISLLICFTGAPPKYKKKSCRKETVLTRKTKNTLNRLVRQPDRSKQGTPRGFLAGLLFYWEVAFWAESVTGFHRAMRKRIIAR